MAEFYMSARSILVKNERYFDLYDQVFGYYFKGLDLPDGEGLILDEIANEMLRQWLKDPRDSRDLR
jgi:uncharacterized protein with von Willebrand factor type A (vWA) domain